MRNEETFNGNPMKIGDVEYVRIETENLEHLINNCIPDLSNTRSVYKILNKKQPDVAWMKKVKRRRNKYNINK